MSTGRRTTRATKKVVYRISSDEDNDSDKDESFAAEEKVKPPPRKRAKKSDATEIKPKNTRKDVKKIITPKKNLKEELIEPATAGVKVKAEIGTAKSSIVSRKSGALDIKPDPEVHQALPDTTATTVRIKTSRWDSAPDVKPDVISLKKESIIDLDEQADELTKPVKKETVAKAKPARKVTKTDVGEDKPPPKKRQKKATKSEPTDEVYSDENRDRNAPDSKMLNKPLHLAKSSGWSVPELLAEKAKIDYYCARNIVTLFENDNTIPFICRYRREIIGSAMTPDDLREVKNCYSTILNLRSKIMTTINGLEKKGVLTDEVRRGFESAKSLDELDMMYAPFKTTGKKTLAERAIALGLEQPALDLLNGVKSELWCDDLIQKDNADLDTLEKVQEGICHIIAHAIGKNVAVLEEVRRLQVLHNLRIEVKKARIVKSQKTNASSVADNAKLTHQMNEMEEKKFEIYYDYSNAVRYLKPHQIMAINRGENYKILSVKIVIPDRLKFDLKRFVEELYLRVGAYSKVRMDTFNAAFEEAFTKRFSQLISKQIRSDLTKLAEYGSIHIFATNLKQLLLMSPIRGEKILGIDPGFTAGCKCALINEFNDLVDTHVIYPHTRPKNWMEYGYEIRDLLTKYDCKVIALGNGTACRETEKWLQRLYTERIVDQNVVRYCIVSEHGASIYSCGPIAKKEFPDLDVNLISAVSIARRLADPLCELVKIEPKHLGVGMYQHDLNEKDLSDALNDIVSECVSYVGVDVNTASVTLLRHVAGLTEVRAQNIIKHRLEHGPFKARKELIKVKQIGEKSFQQCAGFIRIDPVTAGSTKCDILDSTWVHPESYETAEHIIAALKLKKCDIGKETFIAAIGANSNDAQYKIFADKMNQPVERIASIFEALQRDVTRDYRSDINKRPLFKQTLTKITDLKVDDVVTGSVTNITDFGCFVDIGVERNGLIHSSKLNGFKVTVGDHVEAMVANLDIQRNRIGLSLKNIL